MLLTDPADNSDDVEAATGLIRLEVVAGAGGTGEAAPARVVRSKTGLRNYLDEDGEIEQDRKVHAGDDEIEIVFKYTPVETINDGDAEIHCSGGLEQTAQTRIQTTTVISRLTH